MSRGKINLQANDGAIIGLVVPDGLTSGERQIALGSNTGSLVPYHLLQGNLAVSNSTITQGMNTTLYTSGSAVTGIDMDTQWGNTVEERFGGLVWLKDRVEATNNFLYDTVRGATKEINSNTNEAEATLAGGLTTFASTGFTVGADTGHNSTTSNMVSWNFQTTHRVSGTTNHGKAIVNHYNPFTGFGIAVYTGSGIAGHDIQTMLGRKVSFATFKNLSVVSDWITYYGNEIYNLQLNTNAANIVASPSWVITDTAIQIGTFTGYNTLNQQYVVYYWANSYFDESNKLIGNYELVTYQGTGAAGNKVKTKGKPAWVMLKRLDSIGEWYIVDNQRGLTSGNSNFLIANTSVIEASNSSLIAIFNEDGFTHNGTAIGANALGGQYIALVAYDTNSNGGGSYYPLASDASNVQINNALIPLAQGIDSNGVKNTILSKNETITGLTYTQGKNYVYCDKNGSYGVTPYKPRYLESELVRTFASEAPEYYDVGKNKWFNTSGHGELITNGTFGSNTTGWSVSAPSTIAVTNGTMLISRVSNSSAYYVQTTVPTVVGKKYKVKCQYSSAGQFILNASTASYGGDLISFVSTAGASGTAEIEFVAQSTTTYIVLGSSGTTSTANVDNISVFATDIVPATEITNSRNYLNHIVHADNDGGVLYVEELPKVEYKDIVKANEFRGKNACTVWVCVDMTTTPPTIKDSYNIGSVVRTATGNGRLYFNTQMDNVNYSWSFGGDYAAGYINSSVTKGLAYFDFASIHYNGTLSNSPLLTLTFFGGRN